MDVFVIHMPHRKDRMDALKRMHKLYPCLNLHVVHGIQHERGLTGCLLSHQMIVRNAKEKGQPYVIVLEDDCDFLLKNGELSKMFHAIFEFLKNHPEIQVVNGCGNMDPLVRGITSFEKSGPLTIVRSPSISTTHCILYTQAGYDAFLAFKEDCIIDYEMNSLNMVYTYPFLAKQLPCYSDIEKKIVNYDNILASEAYVKSLVS